MSRTDDLRGKGATERTGGSEGGGPPFLRWGQHYAYVEGRINDFWTHNKYGPVAVFKVSGTDGGLDAKGKDEEGNPYVVAVETGMDLNVGLGYAALEDRIVKEDVGKTFHISFEGWQEPKSGGKPYRVFAVLEMEPSGTQGPVDPKRPPMRGERDTRPMSQAQAVGGGPGAPGEEGPPVGEYEDYG